MGERGGMALAGAGVGLVFTPLLVQEEVAALFVADLGAVEEALLLSEVPASSPILFTLSSATAALAC